MNPIRINLEQLKNKTIPIGREGENEYTIVRIDCGKVFAEHPQAEVSMKVKPPKGIVYPVTVEREGNEIVWTVHDYDLASKGDGQFQLTFTDGTVICKTAIGRTLVLKSLEGNGPAPTPIDDWMQEAQEALDAVEDAEVNQPMIGEDGYWYTWDQEAGEYQKTDTKAEGQDGEDGHTPVLTSSKSGKTTTIYADGDQLAQIQDGQDANIDDTSTAADKVWSAAKSNTLLSEIQGLVSTGEMPKVETTDVSDLTWNVGYVTNGSISSSDSYRYTTIPVQKGDIIQPYDGGSDLTIRFADLMNGSTVVSALSYQHPLNVPDGVDSVVISIAKSYVIKESFVVKKTRRTTETVEIGRVPAIENHVISDEENSIRFTFNLEANSVFSDPLNRSLSDGCGYNIVFNAKISSALTGQVVVGKGYGNGDGAAVGVDATNIYIYVNGAAIGSPSYTQAHGLTLKDYICIEVDADYSITTCKVRLKTNGGEYSYTPTRWRSQNGIMSVRSTLDALTNCMLSYACPALDNDIWIYGDSYLSWYNDNRWAYWLVNAGHTKYLLNSFPGRASIAAYDSFLTDISMNKLPKKIIWCMGMNDKDNADTPNDNWKFAVDSLMEFCADKKIELILSTIPNVTADTTKNTLKNAYVVASGYRFIDFAKAVSADGSTTWYDNMLYNDNVHPTKEGAKALYAAAIATVPELLKY